MAYIDGDFLDDVFGAGNVTALTPTTAERDLLITMAQGATHSALVVAGYDAVAPGDYASTGSDCPDAIRLACFGEWLRLAHLRNRKELPEVAKSYTEYAQMIRDGRMEIPDAAKIASRAVGGVVKADTTSTTADGGRSAIFTRTKMDGYG